MLLLFALFFDDFFLQNFWSKFLEKGDKKLDLNYEYDSSFNQIYPCKSTSSSKYSTTNIFF